MTLHISIARAARWGAPALAVTAILVAAHAAPPAATSKAHRTSVSTEVRLASRSTSTSVRPAASSAAAGIVIGIDPESGTLAMPTPDQMARLAAMRKRIGATAARPAPVYHANGSVSMDVSGWMRDYAVVRRGPDVRLVTGCVEGVQGKDAAFRAAHEAPARPAALEER